MKKRYVLIVAALTVAMLAMGACSKNTLVMDGSSEKRVTIEASKAAEGDFALTGSLELADGEQVVMSSDMKKGRLQVELYAAPADQSVDEIPDLQGSEPVMVLYTDSKDSISGTLPEGSYMVKAVVTEKATGTVQLDVTKTDN